MYTKEQIQEAADLLGGNYKQMLEWLSEEVERLGGFSSTTSDLSCECTGLPVCHGCKADFTVG